MRVTVTGSAGFIASRLALSGHFVQNIDLVDGNDVSSDETAIAIRHFDPEVVFHLAAHHYIPWCNDHPSETRKTNVVGTLNVLDACGPSLRTFVLASSAAVYGFSSFPLSEDDELLGQGIYAKSKRDAEWALHDFSVRRPDVRCVAARLFNVVGTGDHHPHILPWVVTELSRNRAVTLGNLWPKRDYVHVQDVADALQFLAASAPVRMSYYNVGTGIGSTVHDLLGLIEQESGRVVNLEAGQPRSDDGDLVSDPSLLGELGWEAKRTLLDAVREVVGEALHDGVRREAEEPELRDEEGSVGEAEGHRRA